MHLTGAVPDPIIALRSSLKSICERCFRSTDRLIWGKYCPSCDARQREAVRGRNAKGNPPAIAKLLHTQRIVFGVGQTSKIVQRPAVINLQEVVLHLAKTALGPASFGRRRVMWSALTRLGPGRPWSAQFELAL